MLNINELTKKADKKVADSRKKLQSIVTSIKSDIKKAEKDYYDTVRNLLDIRKVLDDRGFCSLGNFPQTRNFHWHTDDDENADEIGMGFDNVRGEMYLIVKRDGSTSSPLIFGNKSGITIGFENVQTLSDWVDYMTRDEKIAKLANDCTINSINRKYELLTYFFTHIEQFAKEYEEYAMNQVK